VAGLKTGPRGPEPGTGRDLSAAQEAEVQALIRRYTPDEVELPFALWSRAAVRELIWQRYRVRLAVRTLGTYLARWDFTAQKPLRRAYEQDPAAVRRWLQQAYPAIVARAKRAGGAVFWGDETGLRADDVRGRSDAPRGRTPQVRVCHKRAGLSLLSAVTNKGELRWMVTDGAVNASVLLRFCQRLIQDARRKVFLILDRLRAHRARLTQDWVAAHRSQIAIFYLPSYSPELNPDEGVNAALKQAVPRRAPARSKPPLKRAAISHMHSLSKRPQQSRAIFHHPQFRYAA
jgi:transposase